MNFDEALELLENNLFTNTKEQVLEHIQHLNESDNINKKKWMVIRNILKDTIDTLKKDDVSDEFISDLKYLLSNVSLFATPPQMLSANICFKQKLTDFKTDEIKDACIKIYNFFK